jgi:uncharacterized membrane protein YraQ (UPF0718 family)
LKGNYKYGAIIIPNHALEEMHLSVLYMVITLLVFGYVAMAFALGMVERRTGNRVHILPVKALSDRARWWLMVFFGLGSLIPLLYCNACEFSELGGPARETSYSYFVYRDLLGVLPWFIWGCILAGFIMKLLSIGKLRLPGTMLGSCALASILPICTCAAIPMAHSMMLSRRIRLRAVVAFLVVVPVLSPVMFLLAVSQIGAFYLIVEIVAIFSLAMVSGVVMERLVGVREPGGRGAPTFTCRGCKGAQVCEGDNPAMLTAWGQLNHLMKYILLGIIIGAAIGFLLEADGIAFISDSELSFLGSPTGLILMVLVAIPLFICSGEEVVILVPLLAGGLQLGHAIAFAIAGNAICITAVPVLNATFGKRLTVLLFASFFIGALVIGFVINWLGLTL